MGQRGKQMQHGLPLGTDHGRGGGQRGCLPFPVQQFNDGDLTMLAIGAWRLIEARLLLEATRSASIVCSRSSRSASA